MASLQSQLLMVSLSHFLSMKGLFFNPWVSDNDCDEHSMPTSLSLVACIVNVHNFN